MSSIRGFVEGLDHGVEVGREVHAQVAALGQARAQQPGGVLVGAWVKAVLLQVILWSYSYVRDGDF